MEFISPCGTWNFLSRPKVASCLFTQSPLCHQLIYHHFSIPVASLVAYRSCFITTSLLYIALNLRSSAAPLLNPLARRVPHPPYSACPDNGVQLPRKPGGGSHRTECTSLYVFMSACGINPGLIFCGAVSRIKKIIQLDEDIAQCSHNATFLIAIATVGLPKGLFIIRFPANMLFPGTIYTIHRRARVQRCQIRTKTAKDHPI